MKFNYLQKRISRSWKRGIGPLSSAYWTRCVEAAIRNSEFRLQDELAHLMMECCCRSLWRNGANWVWLIEASHGNQFNAMPSVKVMHAWSVYRATSEKVKTKSEKLFALHFHKINEGVHILKASKMAIASWNRLPELPIRSTQKKMMTHSLSYYCDTLQHPCMFRLNWKELSRMVALQFFYVSCICGLTSFVQFSHAEAHFSSCIWFFIKHIWY